MNGRPGWSLGVALLLAGTAFAQSEGDEFFAPPAEDSLTDRITFSGFIHGAYRDTDEHDVGVRLDPQTVIHLHTPDPGQSFEIPSASLTIEAAFSDTATGHIKLDFIDLYDRNPTTTDDLIDIDEVWVRFGQKYESRILPPGSSFYALLGKAPKFEKQITRSMESYGLVSTAMNRMEDIQLQFGGSVGRYVYWRAQVSEGGPLFMRDPGLLAGDNGTRDIGDEEQELGSGFPILYDAEVEWLSPEGDTTELGAGLGFRIGDDGGSFALDLLGFYYQRDLADHQELRGTSYGGDLDLLSFGTVAIPTDGREKTEMGANLDFSWAGLGVFVQWVDEDIAGLERDGLEGELKYRVALPPALAWNGRQLFTYIQPAVRWSRLDNDFGPVAGFPAPSFWWDWEKLDAALRVGLLPNVDFTLEWSRQDVEAKVPFEVDEALATVHFGF